MPSSTSNQHKNSKSINKSTVHGGSLGLVQSAAQFEYSRGMPTNNIRPSNKFD